MEKALPSGKFFTVPLKRFLFLTLFMGKYPRFLDSPCFSSNNTRKCFILISKTENDFLFPFPFLTLRLKKKN